MTSAGSFKSINGAKAALEGDKVWCPKCGSEGVIMLDGPRLTSTCNGKPYALNDDLCMCKCSPPPRLVAAQNLALQRIDTDWHADQSAAAAETAAKRNTVAPSATEPEGVPILLLDPDTHEPLKQRPYRLQLTDKVVEGTTDQHGATRPLSVSERASLVTWHVDRAGNAGIP